MSEFFLTIADLLIFMMLILTPYVI